MPLTSQQYADLAAFSYKEGYPIGVRRPGQEEHVPIGGITYKILEHVDNARNGYQGFMLQRTDTGQIVVAHRGTEQIFKDGMVVDGAMVLSRANLQAGDAIALTQRAVKHAERIEARTGNAPEVTVTGHSLGGTLAQITAHHHNLRGETFNAYGAASLDRRIPEGRDTVVNHVLAADTVSAASPHFGQVRVYAKPSEITVLQQSGYENNRSVLLDQRSPLLAVARTFGSHSMHNFTNVDGDGRPDRSILADPRAQQLAAQFDPMIDKYRNDVGLLRAGITTAARGPLGTIEDAVDRIRGPLDPGEPARREQRATPTPAPPQHKPSTPQPYDSPLFGPGALQDFREYVPKPQEGPQAPLRAQSLNDSTHPDAPMYQSILRHVQAEDRKRGREPDDASERLAAGLTVDAKARGLQSVGFFQMSSDGTRAYMADATDPSAPWAKTAAGDIAAAVRQDLQASSDKVANINQTQAQTLAQQQSNPMQDDPSPKGPKLA
ncbi:MAG: hypothetical protein JNM58_03400 [Xanthomonadaceae bacterium]|nr:hypothetical protein [Xanthomonadaceae bacterium]